MANKRRTYSTEERNDVLNRIANGESVADICSDTGIKNTSIYSWISKQRGNKTAKKEAKNTKASNKKAIKVVAPSVDEIGILVANFTKELQVLTVRKIINTIENNLKAVNS